MNKPTLIFGGVLILALTLSNQKVFADALGQITQYQVPSGDNPYDITQGADGKIYFTQESGKKIWKFDQSTNIFSSWPLVNNGHMVTKGPDGAVWFNEGSKYGRLTSGGILTEYSMPFVKVGNSNVYYSARGITTGPDGRVWMLGYNSGIPTKLFQINANGVIYKEYLVGGTEPIEVTADFSNGLIWYVTRDLTTSPKTSKIGKIDSIGNKVEWTMPTGTQSVISVTVGPDGKTWYTAAGNRYGNVDKDGNFSTVYQAPTGSSSGIWRIRSGADGYLWTTLTSIGRLARFNVDGSGNGYFLSSVLTGGSYYGTYPIGLAAVSDGNMWFAQYYGNKIGKIGTGIGENSTDADQDNLNYSQELLQGTSDQVDDSDYDGLSDYIESQWYLNRQATFCGIECAYPHPLQKDIYVEIDWMDNGEYSMKPTNTQLAKVQQAFSNKGINIVFDTGQYGGGNQVDYSNSLWFTSIGGERDFVDYKFGGDGVVGANFNSGRDGVWHYTIVADHYRYLDDNGIEQNNSSGIANVSGPNALIAAGRVANMIEPYPEYDYDTAIAGTIIHELGHNLCLSSTGINTSCTFAGIDNNNMQYTQYVSSMNYGYQLTLVDYSSGANGISVDYNDWQSLRPQNIIGANDDSGFGQSRTDSGVKSKYNSMTSKRLSSFKNRIGVSEIRKIK